MTPSATVDLPAAGLQPGDVDAARHAPPSSHTVLRSDLSHRTGYAAILRSCQVTWRSAIVVAVPPVARVRRGRTGAPPGPLEPGVLRRLGVRRRDGDPTRFVGFNRRQGYVWFTTCRVVSRRAGAGVRLRREHVRAAGVPLGLPVRAAVEGGTEVTEYWIDRRSPGAPAAGPRLHRHGHAHAPGGQPRGHAYDAGAPQARTRIPVDLGVRRSRDLGVRGTVDQGF